MIYCRSFSHIFIYSLEIIQMKPSKNLLIYLIFAILIFLTFQCQPNSKIADLTTGFVAFQIQTKNESTQTYTYQTYSLAIPRKNERNSQISYSFAIKDALPLTSNIMYFDLLVLQTCEASLIVNFIYEPNKWSKIAYNYLLSYRNDLYIGVQTYLEKQFTKSPQGYKLQTSITINQEGRKESDYIVMAFLNGLRCKSHQNTTDNYLSFAFSEQYVANSTIVLAFDDHTSADILSLTFSYIAYAPALVKFGSYGGTINEYQFKGKSSKNIHYLFPNYHFYAIYGLSALSSNGSGFSYHSELNQNYSFNYQINEWQTLKSLEISYVILGVMPSKICQKVSQCQSEGSLYIYQQQCIQSCPKQSKPFTYIDGAIQCQQCPANQSFSNLTQKCECNEGYTLENLKNCILIPQKEEKGKAGVTYSRLNNGDSLDDSQLSLDGCITLIDIQQSNKNVFVKLKASQIVLKDVHSKDRNFLNLDFPDRDKAASSYYCNKCPVQPQNYECLLLFAKGVPTTIFTMKFQATLTVKGEPKLYSLPVPFKSVKSGQ